VSENNGNGGPVTVKLRKPIDFGSQRIEELTFRGPTGKEMRHLPYRDGYPMAPVLWLAGKISGQPDAVIDKLEGEDLAEVIAVASDFMPGSRTTGSELSGS
jgi:hypothetical protein